MLAQSIEWTRELRTELEEIVGFAGAGTVIKAKGIAWTQAVPEKDRS